MSYAWASRRSPALLQRCVVQNLAVRKAVAKTDGTLRARGTASQQVISWRTRAHAILERRGDALITCANLFQLSGFACTDLLWLQALMIVGNGCMALFFITRMPPFPVPFGWAFLKTGINVFMVWKIVNDRQPIKLSPEELAIYEEHFMNFGITARQFKRFWDLGETHSLQDGKVITTQGEPVDFLSLVINGRTRRTRDGKIVRSLESFPGARDREGGDAGAWIGEMTLLRLIDSACQRSTVVGGDADGGTTDAGYVKGLQRTLKGFGLYDGSIDGMAGQKTNRALEKLATTAGMDLDGVDGPRTQMAQKQLWARLGEKKESAALWTVYSAHDTVIRSWSIDVLIPLIRKDPELRGMLRKAFSQAAVKKTVALHCLFNPELEEAALVGDVTSLEGSNRSARREAVICYEKALSKVLKGGHVAAGDKAAFADYRKDHGISDAEHASALKLAAWTVEDYDIGQQRAHLAIDALQQSRASQALKKYS